MKKNSIKAANPWDGSAQVVKDSSTASVRVEEDACVPNLPLYMHLKELRRRCLIWLLGTAIAFFILFTWWGDLLMQVVTEPVRRLNIEFIYVNLAEAFSAQLKVALIAALLCTLPLLIWQIWQFVQPAFYREEKVYFRWLLLIILGLFTVGVIFGYTIVFVTSISFFVYSGQNFARPLLSISAYVNFLLGFVLPFGIAFELPVVCYVLGRTGIITCENLVSARRCVILIIFIISAILTPPDVLSQVMMALPLCVLYEVSIFVMRICNRGAHAPQSD